MVILYKELCTLNCSMTHRNHKHCKNDGEGKGAALQFLTSLLADRASSRRSFTEPPLEGDWPTLPCGPDVWEEVGVPTLLPHHVE